MTKTSKQTDNDQAGLYPIRTVADLTGVNPITLRAWERRYGLLEPVRLPSGHRVYSQSHIDLITRVVGLLERGMRIGQVKAYLESDAGESGNARRTDETWSRYRERMITGVIRFDEAALEDSYTEALSLYPVTDVTEHLLTPLLEELGERWAKNEGSIAEEHFFSFYMRNKLGARFHHLVKTNGGPTLLLSCLPGEQHETGLLIFALTANAAGYATIALGADLPLEELPAVATKTGCQAIVLSGFLQPNPVLLNKSLPKLARSVDIPVYLGGNASIRAHDAIKRAGAYPLGTDMKAGLAKIRKEVPLT